MSEQYNKWKAVGFIILAGIFVFVGTNIVLAAWNDPSCPPPGCNTEPPINIGPNPQTKIGDLGTAGDLIVGSNLGIGTITPQARLHVQGDFLSFTTTTLASNPVSVIIAGDRNSVASDDLGGKLRVFGGFSVWGSRMSDNKYASLKTSASGESELNTRNGNTQGNLSILPNKLNRDGGNLYIKSDSQSGSVEIGKGGLANVSIQGSLSVNQRLVPSSYFYTKAGQPKSQAINWNQSPSAAAGWGPGWTSNRMSCDTTFTGEECTDNSYSATAGDPAKKYDLVVLGETLSGELCPPPPNGNSNCTYTLAAREFIKNTTPGTAQGGLFSALEGSFSSSVKSPLYCPPGGDPSSFQCLFMLGTGAMITPQKLIVGGLESGQALFGGSESLFVNALGNSTTTTRIGLQNAQSGKRTGLYSYSQNPTTNVFGLQVSDDNSGTGSNITPTAWLLANLGTNKWGLNTQPGTNTLTVAGSIAASGLCLNGDCRSSWSTGGGNSGGSLDGNGSANRLAKWSGGSTLEASSVVDTNSMFRISHTNVNIDNGLLINYQDNANLRAGSPFSDFEKGSLRFGGSLSGEAIYSNRVLGSENRYGLSFMTAFNPRLIITNGGNVGIGVVDPVEKLHVVGNIRVTGNVHATQYCDQNGANCFAPASVNGGGGGGGGTKHYQTYNNTNLGDSLTMNNLRPGKHYAISVFGGKAGGNNTQTIPAIALRGCAGSSGDLARTVVHPNINWPDGWMTLSHTFYIEVPASGCVYAVFDGVSGAMNSAGINTVSVAQLD